MLTKKHFLTSAALVVAAMFIVDAASAGSYRSKNVGPADWADAASWQVFISPNWVNASSAPGASDFATIRVGHEIDVASEDANQSVDHMDVYGRLDIEVGRTLTIDGSDNATTRVDGTINLEGASSRLLFTKPGANNHTIGFDNTQGTIAGASNTASITIGTGNPTVTNKVIIAGALEIRAASGKLTNDTGGFVRANRSASPWTLTLYDGTFDGAGTYEVSTNSLAALSFRAGVTATGLSGPFTVSNGTLKIHEDVTTTGDLTQTGGTINAAANPSKTFTAG